MALSFMLICFPVTATWLAIAPEHAPKDVEQSDDGWETDIRYYISEKTDMGPSLR